MDPIKSASAGSAAGRWFLLTLAEQMGNIGSEVGRARRWRTEAPARFQAAVSRALDLFDLTLADPRWKTGRKEIARAREVLCGVCFDGDSYGTSLEDLERYHATFALKARRAH